MHPRPIDSNPSRRGSCACTGGNIAGVGAESITGPAARGRHLRPGSNQRREPERVRALQVSGNKIAKVSGTTGEADGQFDANVGGGSKGFGIAARCALRIS